MKTHILLVLLCLPSYSVYAADTAQKACPVWSSKQSSITFKSPAKDEVCFVRFTRINGVLTVVEQGVESSGDGMTYCTDSKEGLVCYCGDDRCKYQQELDESTSIFDYESTNEISDPEIRKEISGALKQHYERMEAPKLSTIVKTTARTETSKPSDAEQAATESEEVMTESEEVMTETEEVVTETEEAVTETEEAVAETEEAATETEEAATEPDAEPGNKSPATTAPSDDVPNEVDSSTQQQATREESTDSQYTDPYRDPDWSRTSIINTDSFTTAAPVSEDFVLPTWGLIIIILFVIGCCVSWTSLTCIISHSVRSLKRKLKASTAYKFIESTVARLPLIRRTPLLPVIMTHRERVQMEKAAAQEAKRRKAAFLKGYREPMERLDERGIQDTGILVMNVPGRITGEEPITSSASLPLGSDPMEIDLSKMTLTHVNTEMETRPSLRPSRTQESLSPTQSVSLPTAKEM